MANDEPWAFHTPGLYRVGIAWGIGVALMGVFAVVIGTLIFLNRTLLATTVLGATVMFGMPWDQSDAAKVTVVGFAAIGLVSLGALIFLAGVVVSLVAFGKSGQRVAIKTSNSIENSRLTERVSLFCVGCGASLVPGGQFCEHCGQRIAIN